jgi:hypothetical protein
VLFEAPRREITSVAVGANGTIYAASVGDKSHNPLPPLPVQGNRLGHHHRGAAGIAAGGQHQRLSVPEGSEIYALTEGQAPRKLWAGKDEIVYALAARPDGLLALTGNRGRIFKIADDGSYADIAHLDAQQGLSLAVPVGRKRRHPHRHRQHRQAGSSLARRKARVRQRRARCRRAGPLWPHRSRARLDRLRTLTRTGNVEQPVRGWSATGSRSRTALVASPAGRFLQWKAVLHAGGVVGSVGVNYLPVNCRPGGGRPGRGAGRAHQSAPSQPGRRRPRSTSLSFVGPPQASLRRDGGPATPLQAIKDRTAITVRWAAHDDNGDDLIFRSICAATANRLAAAQGQHHRQGLQL